MSKLIAIRVPDDLSTRLDTRCGIRKRSKTDVLLEAIERGWDDMPAISGSETFGVAINAKSGPIPDCTIKPTMAELRSICAGNVPQQLIPEPAPVEDCTPECCECGHKLTGKVVKGVVVAWACPDLGCAMYGLEQRR